MLQRKGPKTGNISISSTNIGLNLSPGVSIETEDDILKENMSLTNISQLKPDNVFDVLTAKTNIDILCIKAKNAFANYDIGTAYDLCIK